MNDEPRKSWDERLRGKDNKQRLREVCLRDATVLAAFRYREATHESYEEMLEKLVVTLAVEKDTYIQSYANALKYSVSPPTVAIPTKNVVLKLGLWEWIKFKLRGGAS